MDQDREDRYITVTEYVERELSEALTADQYRRMEQVRLSAQYEQRDTVAEDDFFFSLGV